jgi:hypothetical protein
MFGTLEDFSAVPILPQPPGMHFWLFNSFVNVLIDDNHERVKNCTGFYKDRRENLPGFAWKSIPSFSNGMI